ncbi:MAG: MC/SLC25 family protein [Legionellaceae bacterium]|nr:MC/SLC25 family protein [Legionellaceae bacterium]
MTEVKKMLDPISSAYVGALVGVLQTAASLPFWSIKTRKQCGYPFSIDPRILYKGVFPATASITLMSVSQVCCTTAIHRWFRKEVNKHHETIEPESQTQRIISALAGGASSTIISNPVGVVITQQHKHDNSTFIQTAIDLSKHHGLGRFYISAVGNGIINSIFTFAFYAAYPLLKTQCSDHLHNELISTIASGICIGLLTGTFTQPFDTIKTLQEKAADEQKISFRKSLKTIYKTRGALGFYSGFIPAVTSTATAVTVAGLLVDKAESHFMNQKHCSI